MTETDRFDILNHAPVGICVVHNDFRVLFWNRCLEDWSGIPSVEITGKCLDEHFPHLKKPKFKARIEPIFEGGPPAIFSPQLHGHLIHCPQPNGDMRIQQTTVSPVPSGEDGVFHALFAIEDVTELSRRVNAHRKMRDQALAEVARRKEIEQQLRESNRMILEQQESAIKEERLKVLLEMAGATAHEMNQPLMVLLGNIELMELDGDIPEGLAPHLREVKAAGGRISDIVKKIQTIRHYETLQYVGKTSIININQKIRILTVNGSEEEFRFISNTMGQSLKLSLSWASTVDRALLLLKEKEFDLVLSAHDLPDGNGLTLLDGMIKGGFDLPSVFITGDGDEVAESRLLKAGASDFIPRSKLTSLSMDHIIERALEKGRLIKETRAVHSMISDTSD